MKYSERIKRKHDFLVKSIETKIDLVGPSESTIMLIDFTNIISEESISELERMAIMMKIRISNFRVITKFFPRLCLEKRNIMKTKSDEELSIAAKIIKNCMVTVKNYEELKGREIKDPKVFLTDEELNTLNNLFIPVKKEKNIYDEEQNNVDSSEEFLTSDEIELGWGEDTTISQLNQSLNYNIRIIK